MALTLIGASGGAALAGSSNRADGQRAYMRWDTARIPGTWRSDAVTITPPPGWYRFRLWVSHDLVVSPNGVGLPGDVPLAATGMSAPAIDTICQVSGGVSVRYLANRECEYRMELTPI